MYIKICGMTTPEAVGAALGARVDAIGFVFAPSPRQLTASAAAALAAPARGRVHCVAVTHHPTQELVDEILAAFRPDVLQTDAEDLSALRVPAGLALLPVVRAGKPLPRPLPGRLLYEGAVSGAGAACDWSGAQAVARRAQPVLAGRLTEATVAQAIERVRPFGVDVSSGVEVRPGIKDAAKVVGFAAAARAAFAAVV